MPKKLCDLMKNWTNSGKDNLIADLSLRSEIAETHDRLPFAHTANLAITKKPDLQAKFRSDPDVGALPIFIILFRIQLLCESDSCF